MTSVTWTCPNCQRRVPNRAPVCHCGTTREQAETGARPPAVAPPTGPRPAGQPGWLPAWSSLTWDLKALIIALGLVVVVGAVVLFYMPHHPDRVQPLLGYADQAPRPPTPSPTVPAKRWKLPWSR